MTPGIEAKHLSLHYGSVVAIDDLSFRLSGGKIYGLLGRNGSGKTSLLSLVAAFRRPTSGSIAVDGQTPFENPDIMRQICFIRDNVDVYEDATVGGALEFAAQFRPEWDADYAASLVARFDLPLKRKVRALSRGMQSALGVTLGLASRAPLTIFDESYLGMDAPARYLFYQELLNDYLEHPRTIILSTHLIGEVEHLLEEVVIIDSGRLLLHEDADTLRSLGCAITGPAAAVDRFATGMTILSEQSLGQTKSVTVYGRISDEMLHDAQGEGLELSRLSIQDLFVHLIKDRRATQ